MTEARACLTETTNQNRSGRSPLKRAIGPAIGVVAVIIGGALLYRTLSAYQWPQIVEAVAAIPLQSVAGGIAFAMLSYFCLTWFDWLGLRYVGQPLRYRRAALASFTSLSIGHNIGFAGLSSGAIRYRFYKRWGLGLADVAKLVVFCGLTVGLGLSTVAGMALVISPDLASRFIGLSDSSFIAIGVSMLALVASYLALSGMTSSRLRMGRWSIDVPSPKLALAQVIIGSLNFMFVAACLHQLILAGADIGYFEVAGAYVVSNIASILSHVPGGVGVLETVLTILLPGAHLIGVLVMFRVIYFLIPLTLGLLLLVFSEFLSDQPRSEPRAKP